MTLTYVTPNDTDTYVTPSDSDTREPNDSDT